MGCRLSQQLHLFPQLLEHRGVFGDLLLLLLLLLLVCILLICVFRSKVHLHVHYFVADLNWT